MAFEQEHSDRLKAFVSSRGKDGSPSAEEVCYLLNTGLLIKDFFVDQQEPVAAPRISKTAQPVRRPRKRRELSAVEKSGSMQAWADMKTTRRDGALFRRYKDMLGQPVPGLPEEVSYCEDAETCPSCDRPFVIDKKEAAQVCTSCGMSRNYMEKGTANLTYDQEMSMATTSNSPYEKINHLNEILAQVQGKETTAIPEAVLDAVKVEFKKDGIRYAREVTPKAVLRYLKKLGEDDWVGFSVLEEPWHEFLQQWVGRYRQNREQPDPEDRHENARLAAACPDKIGVLDLLLGHRVCRSVICPRYVCSPSNQHNGQGQTDVQQIEEHLPDVCFGVDDHGGQGHLLRHRKNYHIIIGMGIGKAQALRFL